MSDNHEPQGGAATRDGRSADTAVVVGSVLEEYEWIARKCPGFVLVTQSLMEVGGKHYDLLALRSEAGDERDVYFDISHFFGKGR